jgi:hypothetical protein
VSLNFFRKSPQPKCILRYFVYSIAVPNLSPTKKKSRTARIQLILDVVFRIDVEVPCARENIMQYTADVLVEEGMKLLALEVDDLYAALGAQLLGQNLPSRVAGFVSYLSALRNACEATDLYRALPSPFSQIEIGNGLRVINDGLRDDGRRYFTDVSPDLRKALCKGDVFDLAETRTPSSVGVVITLVGAALRIPREFDAISVTISAIILKIGLPNFCRFADLSADERRRRDSKLEL